MTLIDYAKYLLNVCGRRFTHLYRRHYLDSTPTLPSLSALLSYIKTQTATIYAHLFSRGCTQSTPTFANLLPTIHQLDTRKIEVYDANISDGCTIPQLLLSQQRLQITEIKDNAYWTDFASASASYALWSSVFPNLTKLTIGLRGTNTTNWIIGNNSSIKELTICVDETSAGLVTGSNVNLEKITYSNLKKVTGGSCCNMGGYTYLPKLEKLLFPELVEITGGQLFQCYNSNPPILNTVSLPKLKYITGSGHILYSTNGGAYTLTQLDLPELDTMTSKPFDNYEGSLGHGIATINMPKVEQINTYVEGPYLDKLYIGYNTNDRTRSIVMTGLTHCTDIELKDGFMKPLNVSTATNLTADNIVNHIIARLGVNTGTAITITLGSTNLGKLTAEQIAVANAKGYTLA